MKWAVGPMTVFALGMGLRAAELLSLPVDLPLLSDNIIAVTCKRQKTREVPLPDYAKADLVRWLRLRARIPGSAERPELWLTHKGEACSVQKYVQVQKQPFHRL